MIYIWICENTHLHIFYYVATHQWRSSDCQVKGKGIRKYFGLTKKQGKFKTNESQILKVFSFSIIILASDDKSIKERRPSELKTEISELKAVFLHKYINGNCYRMIKFTFLKANYAYSTILERFFFWQNNTFYNVNNLNKKWQS